MSEGEADLGAETGTCRYFGDLPGGRTGGKRVGSRGSEGAGVAAVVEGGWMGRVVVVVVAAAVAVKGSCGEKVEMETGVPLSMLLLLGKEGGPTETRRR